MKYVLTIITLCGSIFISGCFFTATSDLVDISFGSNSHLCEITQDETPATE